MYLKNVTTKSTRSYLEDIKILKEKQPLFFVKGKSDIMGREKFFGRRFSMAETYFPMLPKVNEEISKVLKDTAGEWKETDINFLQGLANSLDCGESIKEMGSVDSIPDMWARPLLFKMALFDLEPTKQFVTGLHEKVRGEWRALLAMFALKNYKQLDLKAEQVNLLEEKSELGEILKSLAPQE